MQNAKCKMQNANSEAADGVMFTFCILNLELRCFYEGSVLLERTAQIDMPGERIRFLAPDEDLHAPDRREVRGDGVDDRVDGQQLGRRSARMSGRDFRAEIDEGISAVGDVERPQCGACRNDRDVRRRCRFQLTLDDLASLCEDAVREWNLALDGG